MDRFLKRENTPKFSIPIERQEFAQNTETKKELLQKERDVNLVEQNLLRQRISLTKDFVNDLPSSDPQYSMLCIQVKMDQIELDELQARANQLISKIKQQDS